MGKKVDLRSTCRGSTCLPAANPSRGEKKRERERGRESCSKAGPSDAGLERARGARYPNGVMGLALSTINMTM